MKAVPEKGCTDRTKQDDNRIVTCCSDYMEYKMTNADRIRAMSDNELARFLTDKLATESQNRLNNEGYTPTATEIESIRHTWYRAWMQWLRQPAEMKENEHGKDKRKNEKGCG